MKMADWLVAYRGDDGEEHFDFFPIREEAEAAMRRLMERFPKWEIFLLEEHQLTPLRSGNVIEFRKRA
jgi:hypothetical protein